MEVYAKLAQGLLDVLGKKMLYEPQLLGDILGLAAGIFLRLFLRLRWRLFLLHAGQHLAPEGAVVQSRNGNAWSCCWQQVIGPPEHDDHVDEDRLHVRLKPLQHASCASGQHLDLLGDRHYLLKEGAQVQRRETVPERRERNAHREEDVLWPITLEIHLQANVTGEALSRRARPLARESAPERIGVVLRVMQAKPGRDALVHGKRRQPDVNPAY
mmetsp:Transcript_102059/g.288206  ORF Transcript_102059/g.288206 Transcript_102059/m.288206 type:complete len:214 (-) Transcript_102059:511-1152(-)